MSTRSYLVLDVGNCGPDHSSIQRLLESAFAAEVDAADSAGQAAEALAGRTYHLVLVNRVLDATGEDGLNLVRELKIEYPELPVMLISNYPEYQHQALRAGAEPGFGKLALFQETTRDLLARYLS